MNVPVPEGATAGPSNGIAHTLRSASATVSERLRFLEIDTRMLGMLLALVGIWLGLNLLSGGTFLSPRNLWNLSVQSASIAIMATGMVLIIVSRNIDLSVGSMLGFLGYAMTMLQGEWIRISLDLGHGKPYTWIVTVIFGLLLGTHIGGL